ncbi:DUF2214 family protein [Variovorax ginsengisoli]|uniref:Membrane protein n=1 Tax=Variovorax ginsengisoli TaxID=363844 RepID=A0ABT9SAZ5_9BURK|nr:DUF2214 family protein [Variovorax ginsengisoli]MDP9901084.1 putative membrane protein [Variovorax ginsengisoli]
MTPGVPDALLGAAHFFCAFALVAVLFAEWCITARPVDHPRMALLARLDMGYGVLAGLVLLAGAARVIWGAKGWAFYTGNSLFWAKLACFAVIGLLSVVPTLRILRWRKATHLPSAEEVRAVHRWMGLQLALLPLLLVLASLMAHGIGY